MVNCLRSAALKDEDLLRYALEGEQLSLPVKAHLDRCSVCQQRLASYQRANRFLLGRLYRCQCPGAARIGHYCAGLLAEDEITLIAGHLAQCPLCASEAEDMHYNLANPMLL